MNAQIESYSLKIIIAYKALFKVITSHKRSFECCYRLSDSIIGGTRPLFCSLHPFRNRSTNIFLYKFSDYIAKP